jgi:two-component system chemotaxis sensor kinase CheA
MNALHEQFVLEARELIHEATNDLIGMEREGTSPERTNRIFRAFHTLKGSAGVVELPSMVLAMHAAEDLLAAVNTRKIGVTAAMIDQTLGCLDQISRWVDAFEMHGSVPADAGEHAEAMARRLRALLANIAESPSVGLDHQTPATPVAGPLPEWISRLLGAERQSISRHLQQQPSMLFAVSYEPRTDCFFQGDDPLALMQAIPNLLAIRIEAREAWPALADFDPYSCILRFVAVCAGNRDDLADVFRLVPDQVQIVEVPVEALPRQGAPAFDGGTLDLVRAIVEEQRLVLTASGERDDLTGRAGAAGRTAANALRHGRLHHLAEPVEGAMETTVASVDVAALLSALDGAVAFLASDTEPAAASDGRTVRAAEPEAEAAGISPSRSPRVNEDRIDALLNLSAELIVAKNAVVHLARRADEELGAHDLARAVKRESETIERLATEMHEAILQLRLVPAAQVFRSFPRLVRDTAQRLDKKATVVTQGETTEADKTIVGRLFEPLLHLVRNVLDHGIESSAERRAAGKPDIATITLRASREGDRFVVEVGDEGRGIDPEAVRRKARERKILTEEDLAALSDEHTINLIFAAGFSTATEISEISGRGVGMDVVRTTVEQLGGRVSLTSRVGVGTTVRLDLPMNIAMTRIMAVEAGGQVFGIPMDAVTETVRLRPDRINRIKGNEGFVLRDRVVPICSLADLMNLPASPNSGGATRLVLVLETGGKIVAIEVDAIRDRLEVVLKPMQGLLSNARGYAGTTLLGDGKVLLVLDIKELLP